MNKQQTYETLIKTLDALLEGETDLVANLANASALLYQYLTDINWAGFYLLKNNELILGPFQGKVACMHIPLTKGVCGACASTLKTQRVDNVHLFPNHIACDSASNAEIVIPLIKNNQLLGVLDIDSPTFNRFDQNDEYFLTLFVEHLLNHLP